MVLCNFMPSLFASLRTFALVIKLKKKIIANIFEHFKKSRNVFDLISGVSRKLSYYFLILPVICLPKYVWLFSRDLSLKVRLQLNGGRHGFFLKLRKDGASEFMALLWWALSSKLS